MVSSIVTGADADGQCVGAAQRQSAAVRNHHWQEVNQLLPLQKTATQSEDGCGVVCRQADGGGDTRLLSHLLTIEPAVWKSSELIFTFVVSQGEAQIPCSLCGQREQEVVSVLGFIAIHSTQSLDDLRGRKKSIKKIQG